MSFAFVVTMTLLGYSVVVAFVLQPPKQDSPASVISAHRCQGESLQSIRKRLLRDLNLQIEPQLPPSVMDGVRKQWKSSFRATLDQSPDAAVPAGPAPSGHVGATDDATTQHQLQCCSMTSEVFMRDLGWDTWVIHPESLTLVECAVCSSTGNAMQCPSTHTETQDATAQVPCCQPTSESTVHIVYMDEFGTVIISSVQMTQSCGCEPPPKPLSSE